MSKGIFTKADVKAQQKEENNTKMNGMHKLLSDEQPVATTSKGAGDSATQIKDMLKDPKVIATCAAVASRRAAR